MVTNDVVGKSYAIQTDYHLKCFDMGLTIILEGEDGGQVHALTEELYCSPQDLYGNNFKILKYIDLFGDTTFNRIQLDDLIDDLLQLQLLLPEQSSFIKEIIELANSSKSKVHTYLKFYGD
jgi:hypothetical protein